MIEPIRQHCVRARWFSVSPCSVSVPVKVTTLYQETTESGVVDNTAMVFGEMNEPPGARLRVALTGRRWRNISVTKKARTSCCSSTTFSASPSRFGVSALLGRMLSAVGQQPTLATEMGELQDVLRVPATDRLRRSRPFTYRQTTYTYRRGDDVRRLGCADEL